MTLLVLGGGLVGLATAALFAQNGHDVLLAEREEGRLEALRRGALPVVAPGLAELFFRYFGEGGGPGGGRIRAAGGIAEEEQQGAAAAFVCVGTPPGAGGALDCGGVAEAALSLCALPQSAPVVVRSTVNPETPRLLEAALRRAGRKNPLALWPEFLAEGCALAGALHPARSVLGAQSEEVFALLSSLCPPGPVFCLSPEEAALAKLCANAYLAVRLAFFGEAADCCAALGADYARVAAAVGADLRIGGRYLDALGGFGGSCLPKDTAALASAAPMAVAEAALRANALRLRRPLGALHRYYRSAAGLPIAVLGLAHKMGTDDCRASPGLLCAQALAEEGAKVRCYDPYVKSGPGKNCQTVRECLQGACAALVFLPLPELCALRPEEWPAAMKEPLILDSADALDHAALSAAGAVCERLGRRAATAQEGGFCGSAWVKIRPEAGSEQAAEAEQHHANGG